MLSRIAIPAKPKSDAERPFWISYADLMTAMMTLCLVTMAVTVIAISQELKQELSAEDKRKADVADICASIKEQLRSRADINVNCEDNRIDFGEAGRFDYNNYRLRPEAEASLAALVPVILDAASSDLGQRWFKQVVIEGYTDIQGPYLYNLYLSLQRSYWVMCTLVDPSRNANMGLSAQQIQQVRQIFLAGGVSFNDAKQTDEASRRVELRLDFYTRAEAGKAAASPDFESTQQDRCSL
jgi:outer membrane protein OmpA-like peptidoglycan-associated protein